jgi:hypothetical protein
MQRLDARSLGYGVYDYDPTNMGNYQTVTGLPAYAPPEFDFGNTYQQQDYDFLNQNFNAGYHSGSSPWWETNLLQPILKSIPAAIAGYAGGQF